MYKLRTIDVWDTLLRRTGHPDFSKLISARAIYLSHSTELATPYEDHWAIFRERCTIEGELANDPQNGDGEYEVLEVLTKLLARLLPSTSSDHLDLAKSLAELELQFELKHTYADPTFAAFSQAYPAEQTQFLSDFYMPASSLQRLLKHHSLDTLVEQGISSCDVGLNKRSGRLFQHVQKQLGVEPHEHLHIGDNLHADVDMPKKQGIQAIHFQPDEEHQQRQKYSAFLHDRNALLLHHSSSVWEQAVAKAEQLSGEERSAYLLGIRTAPLIIGFVLHIAEQTLLNNIEQLYFFTREGEFFLRVWHALFPDNKLAGLDLPPTALLEVSRIATFGPSLQEISVEELMRLWNLYSTQSIFALLKSLGLDPETLREVCHSHGINLMEDITYPWQDGRVLALFSDPNFYTPIQIQLNTDRTNLLGYLHQRGWPQNPSKVGIVDIGWRGTIQDNLAYLQPKTQIFGYYLGLQRYLNPQPINCQKSAFCVDANQSTDSIALLDAVSLIEMLCNSPNGSVSGYTLNPDGSITATRIIDEGENAVHHSFVRHFQQGSLFASQLWSNIIDNNIVSSIELRNVACDIWHDLVAKTDQNLAEAYASLSHNELFGVGKFIDKSNVPTPWQLFYGIFSRKTRQDVILYVRQTQWIAGVSGRKDLSLPHKLLLMTVLALGKCYKRILYWRRYRNNKK